jgi:hypothetical protein
VLCCVMGQGSRENNGCRNTNWHSINRAAAVGDSLSRMACFEWVVAEGPTKKAAHCYSALHAPSLVLLLPHQ